VVARLDDQTLRAESDAKRAAAAVASAEVGVVSQQLKDVKAKYDDIADGRKKIADAQRTLSEAKAKIKTQRAKLKRAKPELTAKRAELTQALAVLPPSPQREQAEQGLKQLDAALAKINDGLRQLAAAGAKVAKGQRQARTGLRELDEAETELDNAVRVLGQVKKLSQALADSAEVLAELADWELGQAQLAVAAAEAGRVVSLAQAGDVLAPGATVAALSPTGPSVVTAWVSPEDRARVCESAQVTLTTDWPGPPLTGQVLSVGETAAYPPSSTATDVVHLTRAFELRVLSDSELPPGAPVSVEIAPCSGQG
jgi:hypothetical protein